MGIRIHKKIGYGLSDVKTRKYDIADSRINGKAFRKFCEDGYSITNEEYGEWLKANSPDNFIDRHFVSREPQPGERRQRTLEDCVTWQSEFGLKNVLLLQPLAVHDWDRYDDSIDWIEESYFPREGDEPQGCYVRELRHGIYPWSGLYMDVRTGKRIDPNGGIMWWIRANSDDDAGYHGDRAGHLDTLAQAAGFKDHAEALANVAPEVPDEVRDVAKFLNLFTSDDVANQLRPMLYVYWS